MKLDLQYFKNLNLLYVEDDINVARPTITMLESFFNKIFYCESAELALELIENETIHLLITDIELTSMSGLELCEKIREKDQKLPIFITTIYDDNDTLKKAIKLNLVDFLVKPINKKMITNTLLETLKKLDKDEKSLFKINEDVVFNPLLGNIIKGNLTVNLTENELKLLTFLIKNKNQLIYKSTIDELLYQDVPMSDAAYKNLIYRLRKKIGKESLATIYKVGVKLNV